MESKPTKFGTISFVLAIVVIALWCVYLILFAMMIEGDVTFGLHPETAGYLLVFGGGFVMMILSILFTIAGIFLGILSIRKQEPKRALAISGLIINLLAFAPFCLLFIMFIAGAVSTSDFMSAFTP